MLNERKASPMNASAVAVAAWIEEMEDAHREIQRELEKLRRATPQDGQGRSMDHILASLRKLRSGSPSPRMITAWVSGGTATRLN